MGMCKGIEESCCYQVGAIVVYKVVSHRKRAMYG